MSALGFRGDTEVAQALAGNSIDIALASSSGLLNLVTANQGVIGFYGGFNQADFSWLAQPAIKSWRDMKGKTLGVATFGSLTDLITRYVLRTQSSRARQGRADHPGRRQPERVSGA